MKTTILAWHFVGNTLRDGRQIPKDGEWLVHEGEPKMCERGLHASLCPFDALNYAPGSTLCRVELSGKIIYGDDKVVATERKILQRKDIECELKRFGADQALSVARLWNMPDIVREYLTTLDENKRDAAWDAAWAAAWTASSAASAAAWDAAWAAAWAAASAAARAAAWDAARAAAWDAARAASSAASAAAWDAASAAAMGAARKQFISVINSKFSI